MDSSGNYFLVDVIAANRLLGDVIDDPQLNTEHRSIELNAPGVYLAFRDQGTCMTLLSVRCFYFECPAVVTSLSVFPTSSPGGGGVASEFAAPASVVRGECVEHATNTGSQPSSYLCTANGSWYHYTGRCFCLPGYQSGENMTKCVGMSLAYLYNQTRKINNC